MPGELTERHSFHDADARWPRHFRDLCVDLRDAGSEPVLDRARGKMWLLLNSLLSQYLRFHAARQGSISPEDVEDIAAEKSSDLLRRIEMGTWNAAARDGTEVVRFLSKVARNGLVDRLRQIGRQVDLETENGPVGSLDVAGLASRMPMVTQPDPPDSSVERREFVAALRECAAELDQRSRRIWFLRVLGGMSSKRIATHPQVALSANHVDVLLLRARKVLRDCMHRKGFEARDLPVGTFAELWLACRFDDAVEFTGVDP